MLNFSMAGISEPANSSYLKPLETTFNHRKIMNIQITVLEKLRSLSLSDYDGYIVSIKGEELCSNSFCVLGIHTKCIEDLNDFKPQCVSPCKTGRI